MSELLVLPVLVPLGTAAACLLARRRPALGRLLSVLGAAGLLAAGLAVLASVLRGGVRVTHLGGWPAPYGIPLVADLFAAALVVLAGLTGLAVAVYSLAGIDARREAFGYHPLLHILLMGVCGAFLTGDVFNLYVWFEVLLIASFVLLVLGGERRQLEGGIKYVTLNLLASVVLLSGVAILYGTAGTLNMADLHGRLRDAPRGLVTALSMLFLVAFGVKAAAFPLFFWLPASYHTPPVPVAALFAALMTKVGVYALVRVFTLVFTQDVGYTHGLILALGGLTMVTGVLGAVAQTDFRRLLAFHIVSQMGYLLMGLGLFSRVALAGAVFFLLHVSAAKAALFLVSGLAGRARGTYDLRQLGGLSVSHPLVAVLFLVPALALAGVPPLSGFFAKLALVKAGLADGRYLIVAAALLVSLLTLFSMIKIWTEAFWKPRPETAGGGDGGGPPAPLPALLLGPAAALGAVTVLMGLFAEPAFALALRAADQLLDPGGYAPAVLGG